MFKNILLAVDLNHLESQGKAVETAIRYVQAFDCQLHVLTIVPGFGLPVVAAHFPEDFEEKALASAKKALHGFIKQALPKGIAVHEMVGHGTIYDEILNAAEELGVDLIILASHRPEMRDYLIGSNASRVIRHANCSVLVVRGQVD